MKKPTDGEILKKIISELETNPRHFSIKLKYKSPGAIYNVVKNINAISLDMRNRIKLTYPQVNINYLDKGEGSPLLRGPQYSNQLDIENIPETTTLEDLLQIPAQLKEIQTQLEEIKNLLKNQSIDN